MTSDSSASRRPIRSRFAAVATAGVAVVLVASACGSPLPKLAPGQNPAGYSGLEVSEDRVGYAIGKLPDIVEEELENSGVPGAAVAVVHRGQVALAEGFGVRSTETDDPVDTATVFPLAALSTPVSATVVAAESAADEVAWSTPVSDLLPWFELSDPEITARVTVGDMFAHRSGLPARAGDELEAIGYDRPAILHGLRRLPLEPFRTSFGVSDFGLTAGAEAVAASTGTSWEQLSRQRLFDPLGMTDTSYSHDDFLDRANRAVGHVRDEQAGSDDPSEVWTPADPPRDPDARAPAAGLSSSVSDMARWMTMVLDDGEASGGAQVVPTDALRQALTPQSVAQPPQSAEDRAGNYGYGFALSSSSSGRVQWGHHETLTQESGTAMLLMPSLDLGVITLTNAAPTGVAATINARFADYAQYGDPAVRWGEFYDDEMKPLLEPVGDLVDAQRPAAPAPPRAEDELVGIYRNDYFGEIEIRRAVGSAEGARAASDGIGDNGDDNGDDNGAAESEADGGYTEALAPLALELGPAPVVWPLEHWDGDTFAVSPVGAQWPPGSRGSVRFDGDEVTIDLLDADGFGTFTRVDDAAPDS